MSKLASTARIVVTLFMARTFGRYEHSVWNGEFHYARYHWRGRSWAIPTSHIEDEAAEEFAERQMRKQQAREEYA
jgi:hypothetical protein